MRGELVIAAIGPLTNLALACKLDIGFPQRVKALYVMGGAERAGNVTPASEFNFHCDPEAAHLVLKKFPHAVSAPALVVCPSPVHILCLLKHSLRLNCLMDAVDEMMAYEAEAACSHAMAVCW